MNPLGLFNNTKKQNGHPRGTIIPIAQRIEKFWNQPVKDSANLLINNVIKDFESRRASNVAA